MARDVPLNDVDTFERGDLLRFCVVTVRTRLAVRTVSVLAIAAIAISTAVLLSSHSTSPSTHGGESPGTLPLVAGETTTTLPSTATTSWRIVTSANAGAGHNELRAVTSVGTSEWAVGFQYNGHADQTLIERQHGAHRGFVVVPSPNHSSLHNELDGIGGIDGAHVWAVGRYQPVGHQERTLIERFNGRAWGIEPSANVGPFHNELVAVIATAAESAWAVGHYDVTTGASDRPLIEHWNGRTWTVANLPNGLRGRLDAVTAIPGTSDEWATGTQLVGGRREVLILRNHAGRWSEVRGLNPGLFGDELLGVAASSATNAWAVGTQFHSLNGSALIERWNGHQWNIAPTPQLAHRYQLAGIAIDRFGRAFAIGYSPTATSDVSLVLQWNGGRWVLDRSAVASSHHNELRGVWAAPSGRSIAVGFFFNGHSDRTLILRCRC